ncbi:hypothetical protein COCOBI_04-2730 [Coccomyxa sp. Obi]|nr:hypothetical protein COCOBI_04-2730 [Coccomyxa sp. Obi]
MLWYSELGRLGGLLLKLGCTNFVRIGGQAKPPPCIAALNVCYRTLIIEAKASKQTAVKFAENELKKELSKAQLDPQKIYDTHKVIYNQLSKDLRTERKAQAFAMGQVKAVEKLVSEKDARLKDAKDVVTAFRERLGIAVAKAMRLEGRFHMRGLFEYSEAKYREKFQNDPTIVGKPMKNATREQLWQAILTHEQPLATCLNQYRVFNAALGPASMASIYRRLSQFIHTDIAPFKSGEGVLTIFVGPVSLEEAKVLQCLADDVGVQSEICGLEPTMPSSASS